MTPEEVGAELARIFSGPPQPRGKDRHRHLQYIPIQRPGGAIEFIRDPFDAEMERIFAEVLDELFGPEVDHGKDELDQRSSHSCQPPRDRFGSGAAV